MSDPKPFALELLKQRAASAGVSNIDRFVCSSDPKAFPGQELALVDVCLATHLCGQGTDQVCCPSTLALPEDIDIPL